MIETDEYVRGYKGLQILIENSDAITKIQDDKDIAAYTVRSQSSSADNSYLIKYNKTLGEWSCDCTDFINNGSIIDEFRNIISIKCKHIWAILYQHEDEAGNGIIRTWVQQQGQH